MRVPILARLARRARFVGACVVLWSSSACTGRMVDEPEPDGWGPEPDTTVLFILQPVDVLFVVDNSGSMAEEQIALASAFGAFIEVLERPWVAIDYRIGITTTDNGNPWCGTTSPEAGALRLSSCRSRPEEFAFDGAGFEMQDACSPTCPEAWTDIEIQPTAVGGSSEVRPRNWIESSRGRTNLPEGLSTTQAFQCVSPQGIDGCGFESQLESMWKAVRRAQDENDPNFGFIRDGAILSVVHVTDEVDCSYNSDWESIFLPEGNRVFWSDADTASPTSAVCWNAGMACEGEGPHYDDCHAVDLDIDGNEVSAEDADDLAVLRPVARYVDLLQDLEDQKQQTVRDQQVLVSVIGGVGADGSVIYQDAVDDPVFQQDFGIGPGCGSEAGTAVPPARLRELAEAFEVGDDRNMFSICESDYSATLTAIAEGIVGQIRPHCMPICVADGDPSTPEVLDPSCSFTQETFASDGSLERLDVPPCESGNVLPEGYDVCFVMLVGDERSETCADEGFNLELRFVRRFGVPVTGGATIVGDCEASESRETDCPGLP
jgi:hypothetical protein